LSKRADDDDEALKYERKLKFFLSRCEEYFKDLSKYPLDAIRYSFLLSYTRLLRMGCEGFKI
jgi:hypothetical protein